MSNLHTIAAGFAVATLSVAGIAPQQQAGPKFEVASIKPREFKPGLLGVEFLPGGRMTANQAPLQMLIWVAYDIYAEQLTGGALPGNTFFDIEAKAEANAIPPGPLTRESRQKLRLMLQSLLADRFKLTYHTEKKELSIYTLLPDKNPHKLRKAADRDCSVTPSPCRWGGGGPASGFEGQSVTVESLADYLATWAGRPVVDKTGIQGNFDIRVPPFSRGAQNPGTLADGVPLDINVPSLPTVVQQELGLRMEPQKQLFDVYVIDHVEKPAEN